MNTNTNTNIPKILIPDHTEYRCSLIENTPLSLEGKPGINNDS